MILNHEKTIRNNISVSFYDNNYYWTTVSLFSIIYDVGFGGESNVLSMHVDLLLGNCVVLLQFS